MIFLLLPSATPSKTEYMLNAEVGVFSLPLLDKAFPPNDNRNSCLRWVFLNFFSSLRLRITTGEFFFFEMIMLKMNRVTLPISFGGVVLAPRSSEISWGVRWMGLQGMLENNGIACPLGTLPKIPTLISLSCSFLVSIRRSRKVVGIAIVP